MSDSVTPRERPWRALVIAAIILILLFFALALWSEREDARTLPADEMEGLEQGPGGV